MICCRCSAPLLTPSIILVPTSANHALCNPLTLRLLPPWATHSPFTERHPSNPLTSPHHPAVPNPFQDVRPPPSALAINLPGRMGHLEAADWQAVMMGGLNAPGGLSRLALLPQVRLPEATG